VSPGTRRACHLQISGVQPKGPVENIDLKPGDVIIALDGHCLYTIDDLRAILRGHEQGDGLQYAIDATDSPTRIISPLLQETRLPANNSVDSRLGHARNKVLSSIGVSADSSS
jgi:S1-C subfamily serine protease